MRSGSSRSTATISLLPSYSTRLCGSGRHVVLGRHDQDRVVRAAVVHRAVQHLPGLRSWKLAVLGLEGDLRQARAGTPAPISTTVSPFFPRVLRACRRRGGRRRRERSRSRRSPRGPAPRSRGPCAVPALLRLDLLLRAEALAEGGHLGRQGLDSLAVLRLARRCWLLRALRPCGPPPSLKSESGFAPSCGGELLGELGSLMLHRRDRASRGSAAAPSRSARCRSCRRVARRARRWPSSIDPAEPVGERPAAGASNSART